MDRSNTWWDNIVSLIKIGLIIFRLAYVTNYLQGYKDSNEALYFSTETCCNYVVVLAEYRIVGHLFAVSRSSLSIKHAQLC